MAELRIFSYLPNPRIWKATIAARLNGVAVEVRGARPRELADWLWDFEARPLSPGEREGFAAAVRVGKVGFKGGELIKTDAFLAAHPFGTVPAAFSPDGVTGIFESNSIMRARWRGLAPSASRSMAAMPTRPRASTASSMPAWCLRATTSITCWP
jgi:elongation factor 1-gamma